MPAGKRLSNAPNFLHPPFSSTDSQFHADFKATALALGLSSELLTLCGQLAMRSTAKLCHHQVHMTYGSVPEPLFGLI